MKRTLLYLIILLSLALPASAADPFFRDVIVTSPDGIWTDPRAYTTLNAAVTAVGANVRTIVIPSAQVVTALTIPANVTLRFERDGSITNSGQLTINTPRIEAAARQIFTGAGDIDFVAGTVVKSSWFVDLDEALDVTSDDTVTIVITESETTTADMAVGNDVTLRWESPFIITVDTTHTLSNVKNIEAGNYQIFAGAGDIDFLDGTVLELSWFTRLRNVITWVEAEEVTLVVSEESIVDFTDTIDPNIELKFNAGGSLSVNGGVILTLPPSAIKAEDSRRLFYGLGTLTYNAAGVIPCNWHPDIHAAISSIGTYNSELIISDTQTLTTDLSVPSTLTLNFNRNGLIDNDGNDLTINDCNIKADYHQIFTGAGDVEFAGDNVELIPQWFGAVGDGTDVSAEFQKTIDALPAIGGTIKVLRPATTYGIGTRLDLPQYTKFEGDWTPSDSYHTFTALGANAVIGVVGTGTYATGANDVINVNIRNINIDGDNVGTIGIEIDIARFVWIENVIVVNCTENSIKMGGVEPVDDVGVEGANRISNIWVKGSRFNESEAANISIFVGQYSSIYIDHNTFGDAVDTAGAILAVDGAVLRIDQNVFAMGSTDVIKLDLSEDYFDVVDGAGNAVELRTYSITNNHFENAAATVLDYIDISPQFGEMSNIEISGNNFVNRQMNFRLEPASECLHDVYVHENVMLFGEGAGIGEMIIGQYAERVFWGPNDYGDIGRTVDTALANGRIVDATGGNPPAGINGIVYDDQLAHTFVLWGDNIDQTIRQPLYVNSGNASETVFIAPRAGWIKSVSIYANDVPTAGEFAIRMQRNQATADEDEIIDLDSANATQIGATGTYKRYLTYEPWEKSFDLNEAIGFIAYESLNTLAPLTIDIQVAIEVIW